MPNVMPASADPRAAPATTVVTCEAATIAYEGDSHSSTDASTVNRLPMTTRARALQDASISAPAAPVASMLAMPPIVITEPGRLDPSLCFAGKRRETDRHRPAHRP